MKTIPYIAPILLTFVMSCDSPGRSKDEAAIPVREYSAAIGAKIIKNIALNKIITFFHTDNEGTADKFRQYIHVTVTFDTGIESAWVDLTENASGFGYISVGPMNVTNDARMVMPVEGMFDTIIAGLEIRVIEQSISIEPMKLVCRFETRYPGAIPQFGKFEIVQNQSFEYIIGKKVQ